MADAPAVRVTFCAVPGVSVNIDGLDVTPAGRPVSETLTDPENPFRALAAMEMDCPLAPAVRLRLAGATVSEKSGGAAAALTVSATLAVWVKPPEVPVRVIGVIPPSADAAAVRAKFWDAPGVNVSVEGLAVTPEGKPVRDTLTSAVNPFIAFAVTATI